MASESAEPLQGEIVSASAGGGHAPPGSGSSPLSGLRRSILEERSGAFWVGTTFGALLAIATTLLIVQNSESASLDWLWLDFDAPLWLLLFLSAVSGAILSQLTPPIWRRVRARKAVENGGRGRRGAR